ncbi:MAG: hypothetical protein LBJ71_04720 [Holosporaceae bacterium]|nr:hypothetical protein [Holosporaceae bacterium]
MVQILRKTVSGCIKRAPSIRKAEELLGWEPVVGMDDLLTKTMNGYFS